MARQYSIEDIDIAINRLLAALSDLLIGVFIAAAGGWNVFALIDFSRRIREATPAASNTSGLPPIAGDR